MNSHRNPKQQSIKTSPLLVMNGIQYVTACFLLCALGLIVWSYRISALIESNSRIQGKIDSKIAYLKREFVADVKDKQAILHNTKNASANSSDLMMLFKSIDSSFSEVQNTLAEISSRSHRKNMGTKRAQLDRIQHNLISDVRLRPSLRIDPIINNLEYFPISPPKSTNGPSITPLSAGDANILASIAIRSKGSFVNYHYVYSSAKVMSTGSYYRYQHNYSDPCLVRYISMKSMPSCGIVNSSKIKVLPLLVVSVQRSGTHYTWEMLNRLGIKVHHEGVGPDGAVGWPYAVNSAGYTPGMKIGFFSKAGYILNNPERLRHQSFAHVFHQVRHPLRVIKTILQRCSKWDKFWKWLSRIKGCESINQTISPLSRAMMLYILWNKHIERYADIRFQSEATSPRDICQWAQFNSSICDQPNFNLKQPIVEPSTVKNLTASDSSSPAAKARRLLYHSQPQPDLTNDSIDRSVPGDWMSPPAASRRLAISWNQSQVLQNASTRELPLSRHHPKLILRYSHLKNKRAASEVEVENIPIPDINVTWAMLDNESVYLANELRVMCIEYGYDLDVNALQQHAATREFSA